jgi:hypothetical protein
MVCLLNKKTLGLIIGAIALASALIWIATSQEIGLSFEMLEP